MKEPTSASPPKADLPLADRGSARPSSGKPRLLLVNRYPGMGGAERVFLNLLRRLDRGRFEAIAATSEEGPLAEAVRRAGGPVVLLPMAELSYRRPQLLLGIADRIRRCSRAVARLVEKMGIDLVHCNGIQAQLQAGPGARAAGVPVVWHMHDILRYLPMNVWAVRRAARFATAVVGVSRGTCLALERMGVERAKIRLIYSASDVGWQERAGPEDREQVRAEMGFSEQTRVIGFMGALEPRKAPEDLLRAAPLILAQYPQARFLLVGGERIGAAPHRPRLETLARDLKIERHVVFTGHRQDVARLLAGMDVLCVPSLNEPLGLVVMEGLFAGVPVVGTRVGGTPEIIADGETGFLVPTRAPRELARRVCQLLADPALARQMAEAGQARAAKLFSVERMVREMEGLYERLLGGVGERKEDGPEGETG
jgi:glycosyltransferase involved in cell wall biosynthesis